MSTNSLNSYEAHEQYKIRNRIEQRLKPLPAHLVVSFAYDVASTVKGTETRPEDVRCLELVGKWLEDNHSVTNQELVEAGDASANVYATTTRPATAAYFAIICARTSSSPSSAFYASSVANAAATLHAAYVYSPDRVARLLEYEQMLEAKIAALPDRD